MKKFLNFAIMTVIAILPLIVNADSKINYNCGEFDDEGIRTCVIGYVIDESTPQESVSVTLTEKGGADITEIGDGDSDFSIISKNEVDGVWTVVLEAPGPVAGEYNLLTFKYKKSGTSNCKVTIGNGDGNKDIVESDTPTENVKTGSTLPYFALGTIALIAVGTYIVTKNKSKIYNI